MGNKPDKSNGMARAVDVAKVHELISECNLVEADLAGEVLKQHREKGGMTISQPKTDEGYVLVRASGTTGEMQIQVQNMPVEKATKALLIAAIDLMRNNAKTDDIHPILSRFMEWTADVANAVHEQWHKDPKNKNKGH